MHKRRRVRARIIQMNSVVCNDNAIGFFFSLRVCVPYEIVIWQADIGGRSNCVRGKDTVPVISAK